MVTAVIVILWIRIYRLTIHSVQYSIFPWRVLLWAPSPGFSPRKLFIWPSCGIVLTGSVLSCRPSIFSHLIAFNIFLIIMTAILWGFFTQKLDWDALIGRSAGEYCFLHSDWLKYQGILFVTFWLAEMLGNIVCDILIGWYAGEHCLWCSDWLKCLGILFVTLWLAEVPGNIACDIVIGWSARKYIVCDIVIGWSAREYCLWHSDWLKCLGILFVTFWLVEMLR